MRFLRSFILLAARLCIAAVFIGASINKFMFFQETIEYMATKNLPAIPLLIVLAAAVEFFGGLSLVLGYKTRFGAFILLAFLVPTTFIFHDFWNASPADVQLQQIMFLKNLAIFGGLLYVFCEGAGGLAIDRCCSSKCSSGSDTCSTHSHTQDTETHH